MARMTARKIISIQHADYERSQKRQLRGSVYRECGYLLHDGTDQPWHSSTPRPWNECWLMNKTYPFRSSFCHLLKRKKVDKECIQTWQGTRDVLYKLSLKIMGCYISKTLKPSIFYDQIVLLQEIYYR